MGVRINSATAIVQPCAANSKPHSSETLAVLRVQRFVPPFGASSQTHLQSASKFHTVVRVPGRPKSKLRSGCPVSRSLEILGDRWSLLVIRDLMIRGAKHFKDFQESGEGIASNILADRLRKLQEAGIISAEAGETDGRRIDYRLTEKGINLAPLLLELLLWGGQHEEDSMPRSMIEKMKHHREAILAEVRRRWREKNTTPLQSKTGEWHLP